MTEETDLYVMMERIVNKYLAVLKHFQKNPSHLLENLGQCLYELSYVQTFIYSLLLSPNKLMPKPMVYWQETMSLFQNFLNGWMNLTPMPNQDKRFSSEEWLQNPFFNLLSHHYSLFMKHLDFLLNDLDLGDKKLTHRIQFFTRHYFDALSPANFIQTNPQVLAKTLQSHGKNFLIGLDNLLTDFDQNISRLMIKLTDTQAFCPGKNVAITPGKVIYRNDIMELIQYLPQTEKVKQIPLLIIPPWINKYYILDLSPNNSFILWLVQHGITVFVLSWINPGARNANKGLDNYLKEGPLTAIDLIKKQLSITKVNALGFCSGGTLLACLLAYCKKKGDTSVRSGTFLATKIDFSEPGDLSVFIDEHQIERVEKLMANQGYLDGRFMFCTYNSLRPNDLIWPFYIKNYLLGQRPIAFDVLYWNSDSTNLSARLHSNFLRWMYLNNDLIKPGGITLNGVPLDVSQIDIPTFFVSTIKDHIAPWKTTYRGFELLKGKKRFLLAGSGHIVGIVNPPGSHKYSFYRNHSTTQPAEKWLHDASEIPGSWWPEWLTWLNKESGRLVVAPTINTLPLPGIMDSPGNYVLKRIKTKHASDS
jgi:polyhydroxyalkanoate synthase